MKKICFYLALSSMVLGAIHMNAQAAEYIVTDTSDEPAYNARCTSTGTATYSCLSLRSAINAANGSRGNDVINLAPGTYTLTKQGAFEDNNTTGDLDVNDAGNTLTISAMNSYTAEDIVITADANSTDDTLGIDRVFHVSSDSQLTLERITITGGASIGGYGYGGGINVSNNAGLTLTNCILLRNYAEVRGGGIYASYATVTLNDSVISANTSDYNGGGVYISGSTFSIENSGISGNAATGASVSSDKGNGGGAYIERSTFNSKNSIISENNSTHLGGGIYTADSIITMAGSKNEITKNKAIYGAGIHAERISSSGNTTLTFHNTVIYENTAESGGGGIGFVSSWDGAAITLTNSIVSKNIAMSGGGINTFGSDPSSLIALTITDSTLSANMGGGICAANSIVTLTNSTLVGNSAFGETIDGVYHGGAGGGLTIVDGVTATLINSTISENTASIGAAIHAFSQIDPVSVVLKHSTISNNIAIVIPDYDNLYHGHNFAAVQLSSSGEESKLSSLIVENSVIANTINGVDCAQYTMGTGTTEIHLTGYNVIEDSGDCTFLDTGTQLIRNDPLLGNLSNNGGPVDTHLPDSASVLIDAIPADQCFSSVNSDARGLSRPQDGHGDNNASCDIGAIEYVYDVAVAFSNPSDDEIVNVYPGDSYTFTALARDDTGPINSVVYSIDGVTVATVTEPDTRGEYSYTWSNIPLGNTRMHKIKVVATNSEGLTASDLTYVNVIIGRPMHN